MFSGTCDVLSVKTQIGDLCIADQSLVMQISMVLRHLLQNNLGIETLVTNQMLPEQSIFSATHVLTPDCVCDLPTYRNTLFLWCLSFDSRPRHRDGRLDPSGDETRVALGIRIGLNNLPLEHRTGLYS